MKKNLIIGFIFLLLIVGVVNAETDTTENPKILNSATSNIPTPELIDNSPPYSFSDNFFQRLFSIKGVVFLFKSLLALIIPLFFVYYTFKNKLNKKKFIFSVISTIILSLSYILFILSLILCLGRMDDWIEGSIILFYLVILPVVGIIIVPWIIYWGYNWIKSKKQF